MTELRSGRILVIEDEVLIALLIESMLEQIGFEVGARASGLAEALAIIENDPGGFDAATLDIDLGGEHADLIVEALDLRRIPFIVATGYTDPSVLARFAGRPLISKPLVAEDLEHALKAILAGQALD